jgi:hypothetical protein
VVVGVATALVGSAAVVLWPEGHRDVSVGAPVAQVPDEKTALAVARQQGTQVEVASLKTENTQVFANPGGSLSMRQSVVPLRVKRDGKLVDIDTSLVKRGDGALATRATEAEVVFSGGGSQPFARMSGGAAEVALTWPKPLPAPEVSGDTATYPEVMPGVDLVARAGREGFGHELVVKTREAAAALTTVRLGFLAKGVTFSADDKGALKAVNAKGETVFSAPAAKMWDSGERTAAVGVAASATELTLTPDRALLTDATAKLPITVDPQFSYLGANQSGWTIVRSGWPGKSYWNYQPEDQRAREQGVARIGVSPDDGNGSIDRSLFIFDTKDLRSTHIQRASFSIKQGWKWFHTCDSRQVLPMDLHSLDRLEDNTTWNTQPGWSPGNRIGSAQPVGKYGHCNPDWVGFDIGGTVQARANERQTGLVLGLKDRDEAGVEGWKRFYVQRELNGTDSYPYIDVEYNHYPDPAEKPFTDPVLGTCKHCAGKSYVKGDRILLKARMTDYEGGSFQGGVLVKGPAYPPAQFPDGMWLDAGYLTSGSIFVGALDLSDKKEGEEYTWRIWSWDGQLDSPKVDGPPFVVDRTPPNSPDVKSALYLPDNDWHGGPGVADRFWFTPNGSADVDHYVYSWNDAPHIPVEIDKLSGPGSIDLTPPGDSGGPVTLYVSSVDRAGNVSVPTQYMFRVRAGQGPKSLWPLDGHSRDEAYLGDRDATLHTGATWTHEGAIGSAVQLDGVDGYLSAPHSVSTDTSFSVSAWVKLDPQNPRLNATAVSQLSSALPGFQLSWRDNNTWGFGIAQLATATVNDFASSPIGSPQTGTWTHLTGVYDVTVNMLRLYVNGSLVGTANRTTPVWNAGGEIRIGDAGSVGQRWKGSVDDVRVYDRALVGNEVRALVGLAEVPAGHWKFDEGIGTTAGNNVPGGTPMTLKSGAKFVPGAVGRAVQLDGVDDIAQTGESVLHTDQSFAVTAWVKQDREGNENQVFTVLSQDADPKSGFFLSQRKVNGVGRWELLAPESKDDPSAPPAQALSSMRSALNTWTHLAGVFDRPGKQIRLYVNGEPAATVPWNSYNASSGPLVVGRGMWTGVANAFWPGAVDEVRTYSRAIGEAEIKGIMTADGVTTGSWKLDGNATDDSGHARHGMVKGNPTWVPGQSNTPNAGDLAVNLDGVADHISAPNAVDTTRSYAVSVWVKPEAANVAQTVVSQDGAMGAIPTEGSGFKLHARADGKWAFTTMTLALVPGSGQYSMVSGSDVQPGVWTHLMGVHDAVRQEISLYVNGIVIGRAPFAKPQGAPKELQIGRGQDAGKPVEFFRGAIDDVRLYPRTLLEEEVPFGSGPDRDLVHNLKADETGGTTAADSVHSRNGALVGGATFASGRSGNSVKLDGVDDAVSTTGVDVPTDKNFTVSAWVQPSEDRNGEVTAVSLDAGQGTKFRLGRVKNQYEDSWFFEMPEQNGTVTKAALSVLPTEIVDEDGNPKWTLLTGVYDAASKRLRLFIDGSRVGDGTLLTPWAGTGGLQLGRSKQGNGYSGYWPGRIDDVRIYSVGLNTERVTELYNSYGAA